MEAAQHLGKGIRYYPVSRYMTAMADGCVVPLLRAPASDKRRGHPMTGVVKGGKQIISMEAARATGE